jgi:hypothetical protein
LCQIKTGGVVENTSIELVSEPIVTFTTADLVWPLFTNAVYKAGTLDTDKSLTVWARPDRIIAL